MAGIHHRGSWQRRLHSIIVILLISEIVFPNIAWVGKRRVSSWPVATVNNRTQQSLFAAVSYGGGGVWLPVPVTGAGIIENWSCIVDELCRVDRDHHGMLIVVSGMDGADGGFTIVCCHAMFM